MAALVFVAILAGALSGNAENVNGTCPQLGSILDCGKRGLTDVPEKLLLWAEKLNLDSNAIQHIKKGAFSGLNELEELVLSKNKLFDLNMDGVCSELPKLRTLNLAKNLLTAVPLFKQCIVLEELNLSSNRISRINPTSLSEMGSLQVLDLRRNKLSGLANNIFPRSLRILVLKENKLVQLLNSSFGALSHLRKLVLSKNQLSDLPPGLFSNLSNLQELDLSINKFRVIYHTTFMELGELRSLNLRRNQMGTLEAGSFLECKQLESLDLTDNRLSELKPGCFYGLASIKELLLSGNRISNLDEQVWLQVGTLTKIDLSHNNLTRLSVRTFSGLKRLQVLQLSHNNLQYIEDNALDDLAELENLDLSSNKLSDSLLSSSQSIFGRLPRLKVLDLRNNSINSLSQKLFHGLTELQRLFLDGNPITTVEHDAFGELGSSLRVLQMNSEKLVCDCKLAWLPAWLKEASFVSSVTGTCHEPSHLRGRSVHLVQHADFTCDAANQYSVPNITTSPAPVTNVLRGDTAVLTCQAMTQGHALVSKAFWMKNAEVVNNSSSTYVEVRAKTDDAATLIYTIVLQVITVTDEDEGRYQCGFVNQYGAAYSLKVDLKVLVFPQFSVLPASIKAKADQDVSLKCAATGQPPPEISIQKDVGHNFPSARDRRFSFNQETNEFIIKKVRAEDAGVYHCVAKNDAGTNVANATVEVLEPPHFTSTMVCPQGRLGAMAVLTCAVEGTPRPSIVWLHNGAVLSPSEQHIFASHMVKLVLASTQPSDAGAYTCQASNVLGKVEESCTLAVTADEGPAAAAPGGGGIGDTSSVAASVSPLLNSTITGVIVISVVACIVGTSLIWVVIIYHTRKKKHRCVGGGVDSNSSHTDDTLMPLPLSCAGSSGTNASGGCDGYMQGISSKHFPLSRLGYESEHVPTAKWCLAVTNADQTCSTRQEDSLSGGMGPMKKGQTLPFVRSSARKWQRWEWDSGSAANTTHHIPAPDSVLVVDNDLDPAVAADEVFSRYASVGDPVCIASEDAASEGDHLSWHCSFGTFQHRAATNDSAPKCWQPSRRLGQSSRLLSM